MGIELTVVLTFAGRIISSSLLDASVLAMRSLTALLHCCCGSEPHLS